MVFMFFYWKRILNLEDGKMKNGRMTIWLMCVVVSLFSFNANSTVIISDPVSFAWAENNKGGSGNPVTWNEYSAYSWQNTTISGNTIYADGGAVDSTPWRYHYSSEWLVQSAGSSMEIEFYVSSPQYLLLNLSVRAAVTCGGACVSDGTQLIVSLIGENGYVFRFNFYDAWVENGFWSDFYWSDQFCESYHIDTGPYILTTQTEAGGAYGSFEYGPGFSYGNGFANYELELIIPEPCTLLLLGLGGFGLLSAGKSKRVASL